MGPRNMGVEAAAADVKIVTPLQLGSAATQSYIAIALELRCHCNRGCKELQRGCNGVALELHHCNCI